MTAEDLRSLDLLLLLNDLAETFSTYTIPEATGMTIFSFQKSKFLNLLAVFVVSILLASVPRSSANASTITEHTQQMLNELGYDSGVVDGMDGPATQAAFEQFVKDNQNLRNANQFEILEHIFDLYRANTGKTISDLVGTQSTSFINRTLDFPNSPFGDLEDLRSVKWQSSYLLDRKMCYPKNSRKYPPAGKVGILLGFIKEDQGRGWRTVAENNSGFSNNGMTARGQYTDHIQSLAMDVLLGEYRMLPYLENNVTPAEQLLATLVNYAERDAFRWYNGGTPGRVTYRDTYGLKTVFTPTIAAWSTLVSVEPELVQDESQKINEWIWRVINRVDYLHQGNSGRNNQRYMLALNLMQLGLLYESEYFVQRALYEATKLGSQQRSDGSLPLETARGTLALSYTGHATVSLMALAEYASLLGMNLYENPETNFKPVFEFYADAVAEPSIIERYAGTRQRDLSNWHFGGMSQFCSRYPETNGCVTALDVSTFRQALPSGHLEYNMGYDAMMNSCISALVQNSD